MRRIAVVSAALVVFLVMSGAARADSVEDYLRRSAAADFGGRQITTCDTPDGSRTAGLEIAQRDGVTTVRSSAEGDVQVRMSGGSFSVASDEGNVATSAVVSVPAPEGRYLVTRVESVETLGRDARRISVVDDQGVDRASMTFDAETGALLVARIRNADGSAYCDVRMVEFTENPMRLDMGAETGAEHTLESIDPPEGFPGSVAGFTRLETFVWDEGGVVGYYSDGLFSFTLLATERPVVLTDASVSATTIDGGDYVRWFGAGQAIYVWDTESGGLALYGDLPLDLQEQVLADLPNPQRIGVLARWWRNLFG